MPAALEATFEATVCFDSLTVWIGVVAQQVFCLLPTHVTKVPRLLFIRTLLPVILLDKVVLGRKALLVFAFHLPPQPLGFQTLGGKYL